MHHCLIFNLTTREKTRSAGAHRIATHLREQGWDCEVIDFAMFWTLEELRELCRSRITSKTKFIGFSQIFQLPDSWNDKIETFCGWLKQTYPDLFLVSGSQQKPIFYSDYIEYSVSGYGEYALDALLKYKVENGPRPQFDLISGKKGHKIISSLHAYPAHPMREPSIIYEDRDFIHPGEWGYVEFSRGCKFSCDFCNFPVLGVKGDYTRTAEGFRRQMMDAYDRFGMENYTVTDETFNDRTDKITKFADVVETLPWKPFFTGFIRGDLMVGRPMDRVELSRMGFLGHFYGIESFNHESAKLVGKGMAPEKLKQGLLDCKDYFKKHNNNLYRGNISLIVGLPHDTIQQSMATKKWIHDNWKDQTTHAWALEITDDTYSSQSKMSLNYEQYGYKKLDTLANQPLMDFMIPYQHTSLINWKNDHMTFALAIKMAHDISIQCELVSNFNLGETLIESNGTAVSLAHRINHLTHTMVREWKGYPFIKEYIRKKLSL